MNFFNKWFYPLFFCCVCMVMAATTAFSAESATAVKTAEVKPARSIVVSYFHTTFRCPTCQQIEALSTQAVKTHFENELKNGKVVFRVVNVDEPENNHYIKDYQLYTKSLIVSQEKEGKEARWKNLDKIWVLVRDEEKFDQYVQTEIASWLKE